jgi:Sigma-70, region 4
MFLLKHREGMTYREIADAFGCSVGAVQKSLSRSLLKLRAALGALDTAAEEVLPGGDFWEGYGERLRERMAQQIRPNSFNPARPLINRKIISAPRPTINKSPCLYGCHRENSSHGRPRRRAPRETASATRASDNFWTETL